MSKALTRSVARLLSITAIAGGAVALSAGAASAACTPNPSPDPNIGVYACADGAIVDSDPSAPGAAVSTAAFVDVNVYGHIRICIGRFIAGGNVYVAPIPVVPDLHVDGLGARVC